jgi:hypothetical protein
MALQEVGFSLRKRNRGSLFRRVLAGVAERREELQLSDKIVRDSAAGIGLEAKKFVEIGVL